MPWVHLYLWLESVPLILLLISCDSQNSIQSEKNNNEIFSIACWDDSKTESDSKSQYPSMLGELLGSFLVYNSGANGETSKEIIQRQGAYPLLCESFVIPASNSDTAQIIINSRLKVPKAGCNPCYICGVKGEIIRKDNKTLFRWHESGSSIKVPSISRFVTDGMINHRHDIMIIGIGYNGGYKEENELVSQIRDMTDYSNNKEYIVFGRVDNR